VRKKSKKVGALEAPIIIMLFIDFLALCADLLEGRDFALFAEIE